MSLKGLKSMVARAEKRRRPIRETRPWYHRDYGWRDRLRHAERVIIEALKANPGRFEVRRDPKNPSTVVIAVPVHEYHALTGWQHKKHGRKRRIIVRIAAKVFFRMGMGDLLPKILENERRKKP